MGIQCMMCKLVSFTISTVPAYSSSFHPGEQWPNPAISSNSQTHILIFSGDLLVLCVSASGFTVSLPSPSWQALLHLSCRPQSWAEHIQSNLQKGKRAHRHTSPLPLLLRLSWHLVKEKMRHVGLSAESKQRNTRESSRLRVQSFLWGLRSSVAGWQLSISSPMANGGLSPSDKYPIVQQRRILSHWQ